MNGDLDFALINWRAFRGVIFDVDGTLYDQRALRRRMMWELLLHSARRPWRGREIKVLRAFRRLREAHADRPEEDLQEAQFRWAAEDTRLDVSVVRQIVDEWIFRRPLRHLLACRPAGLEELFFRLRSASIAVGVFSDYPVREKLSALGLSADVSMCATDACVNRFKPDPAGLLEVCRRMGVQPNACLHIGDREEKDAVAARAAGCYSIILPARIAIRKGRQVTYDRMFARNDSED